MVQMHFASTWPCAKELWHAWLPLLPRLFLSWPAAGIAKFQGAFWIGVHWQQKPSLTPLPREPIDMPISSRKQMSHSFDVYPHKPNHKPNDFLIMICKSKFATSNASCLFQLRLLSLLLSACSGPYGFSGLLDGWAAPSPSLHFGWELFITPNRPQKNRQMRRIHEVISVISVISQITGEPVPDLLNHPGNKLSALKYWTSAWSESILLCRLIFAIDFELGIRDTKYSLRSI